MAAYRSCCSFQVLFYVCCLFLPAFGSHVRQLSSNDLKDIGKSTTKDFIVVFFDKPGKRVLFFDQIDCYCIILNIEVKKFNVILNLVITLMIIYFYFLAIRKSNPKITRVFAKSSSILDSFGFELAKVMIALIYINITCNRLQTR